MLQDQRRVEVLRPLLTTAGEIVLNPMFFAAYSSANALLAAGIGDFDSTAKSSVAVPLG
jgi:hypothetical protein